MNAIAIRSICGLIALTLSLPLAAQRPTTRRLPTSEPPTIVMIDSTKAKMDRLAAKLELEKTNKRAAADSVGGLAVVEKDRVVFTLVRPKVRTPIAIGKSPGHYVWRIDVASREPISFVVKSDTAMSSDNLSRIMQASHFRRCDEPLNISVLRCVGVMSGTARIKDDELRIETRDSAVVAQLRKYRPAMGHHLVFEPEGRFYSDAFRILYR